MQAATPTKSCARIPMCSPMRLPQIRSAACAAPWMCSRGFAGAPKCPSVQRGSIREPEVESGALLMAYLAAVLACCTSYELASAGTGLLQTSCIEDAHNIRACGQAGK